MLIINILDKKILFFFVIMLVFLDFLFFSLCKNFIKFLVKFIFISIKIDIIIYFVLFNLGIWIVVFLFILFFISEKWCY